MAAPFTAAIKIFGNDSLRTSARAVPAAISWAIVGPPAEGGMRTFPAQ